jgi:hypothetical protein
LSRVRAKLVIICLLVGGFIGIILHFGIFPIMQGTKTTDYDTLSEKIQNLETEIELIKSELNLDASSGDILIHEKGVMGQNHPYTWYLDLEENTTISINFQLDYHDLSQSPYGFNDPLIMYWIVKWDSSQYTSFWEPLGEDMLEGYAIFSTERWLEVLPETTPSVPF